jgi:hypothetical protein
MLHSLFISGNCSTWFGWYFHPSSGTHSTVSTASGICHTVTVFCHYRGRVGIRLSVLWVAYAVGLYNAICIYCEVGVVCYTGEACNCCSDVAAQLWERAYLVYTSRPTVRGVYSTEHRLDVIWQKSVAVRGHADGIHRHVIGKSRTPGTCILEFRNVCLRERKRGCVCACIRCVGGMWRRVTYGQPGWLKLSFVQEVSRFLLNWSVDRSTFFIRSRGIVIGILAGLWAECSGVRIRVGQQTFPFSESSRASLEPTQPHIWRVLGFCFGVKAAGCVKLTTYLHLVPILMNRVRPCTVASS